MYLLWRDAVGDLVLSGPRTVFEVSRTAALLEATAGNADHHTFLPALAGFRAKWQGFYGSAADASLTAAALARLAPRAEGQLIWGEFGNGPGMPKRGFNVIIIGQQMAMPSGIAAAALTLEFQGTGGPLFAEDAVFS